MPTVKEEMNALDRRNFEWYKNLTDEERKDLSMWVLMRYASSTNSKVPEINHHYLTMVNEIVNVHFNVLRHHPELQWRLMQVCSVGTSQFHLWIPPGKRKTSGKNNSKISAFYLGLFPHLSDEEVDMSLDAMTTAEKTAMLESAGLDKKQIKDYLK